MHHVIAVIYNSISMMTETQCARRNKSSFLVGKCMWLQRYSIKWMQQTITFQLEISTVRFGMDGHKKEKNIMVGIYVHPLNSKKV